MESDEWYRDITLEIITREMPQRLWRRIMERWRSAYMDVFSSVRADSMLLDEQRIQKLYQDRYFRLENDLIAAATDVGLAACPNLIGENGFFYACAGTDSVVLTQSYVQTTGKMPTPAAFRKQLAEMAEFERASRLDLGDVPTSLITPKKVHGILLHSPVGKKFSERDQALGSVGLYVPYKDYRGWAVELPLIEIISAYEITEEREDRADTSWKKKKGTGSEE